MAACLFPRTAAQSSLLADVRITVGAFWPLDHAERPALPGVEVGDPHNAV